MCPFFFASYFFPPLSRGSSPSVDFAEFVFLLFLLSFNRRQSPSEDEMARFENLFFSVLRILFFVFRIWLLCRSPWAPETQKQFSKQKKNSNSQNRKKKCFVFVCRSPWASEDELTSEDEVRQWKRGEVTVLKKKKRRRKEKRRRKKMKNEMRHWKRGEVTVVQRKKKKKKKRREKLKWNAALKEGTVVQRKKKKKREIFAHPKPYTILNPTHTDTGRTAQRTDDVTYVYDDVT